MFRLKELRQRRGLTQLDMAYHLGVTLTQYQRYEAGTSSPRLDAVIKIADYFGVSIDYLVGRTDDIDNKLLLYIEFQHKYNSLNEEHRQIVDRLIEQLITIEHPF